MPDYIDHDDPGSLLWLSNFNTWLGANGGAHGITAGEIAAMGTNVTGYSSALSDHETAQAEARAATQAKNAAKKKAIDLARDLAQRLQATPSMTDADRAAAGITVRDTTPTPGPTDVATIPPPLLLLDFSVRRQVTIHWGTNPANEGRNARPKGTMGVQLSWARGGIPTNEASWAVLDNDTESPYIHELNESAPVSIAYRARYIGKNLKLGPLGDPVVCTISV